MSSVFDDETLTLLSRFTSKLESDGEVEGEVAGEREVEEDKDDGECDWIVKLGLEAARGKGDD